MSNIERLSVIILCAGEGKRLQDIAPGTPKSILTSNFWKKSFLELTLTHFLRKEIDKIIVIYGFKANTFENYIENSDYIRKLKANQKVFLLNTGSSYKKGPFHSFLSLIKATELDLEELDMLLIPGDILFSKKWISTVLEVVMEHIKKNSQHPLMFYRKIDEIIIDQYRKRNCKNLSTLEFEWEGGQSFVRSIHSTDLLNDLKEEDVFQTVPIFYFPGLFLHYITQLKEINLDHYAKLTEFLNQVYLKEEKVIAIELNKELAFYELDTKEDYEYIIENRKEILKKLKNGG